MRTPAEEAAYLDGYERGIRARRNRSEAECMAMVDLLYEAASEETKRELDYPDDPTRRPWAERRQRTRAVKAEPAEASRPTYTALVRMARVAPVHSITRAFEFEAFDEEAASREVYQAAKRGGYSAYSVTEVLELERVYKD